MNSVSITLIFGIMLVVMLLGTGCIEQPAYRNVTITDKATVSPSTVNTQPVQTRYLPSGNTKTWIIINPIGIHYKSETFEINGTTNLGPDEKFRYTLSRGGVVVSIPGPNGASNSLYDNGAANISYGEFSISDDQKWSFWLNSSGPEYYNPYGAAFFVNVSSENLTIRNSTYFYLK